MLFEAGLDRLCDTIIFVDVPREVRMVRARQSRGWDETELNRREIQQIPVDKKRSRADHIVENNSEINSLRQEIEKLYHQIVNS